MNILFINLQKESQVYSDAKTLEEYLDIMLEKWVPSLAYDAYLQSFPNEEEEEEDESIQPLKRIRRAISDWPEPLTPLDLPGVTVSQPPDNGDLMEL